MAEATAAVVAGTQAVSAEVTPEALPDMLVSAAVAVRVPGLGAEAPQPQDLALMPSADRAARHSLVASQGFLHHTFPRRALSLPARASRAVRSCMMGSAVRASATETGSATSASGITVSVSHAVQLLDGPGGTRAITIRGGGGIPTQATIRIIRTIRLSRSK